MSKLAAAFAVAALAFATPAYAAQDQDHPIVLRVDSGTTLTSTGGEFTSATTGKPLQVGEKVLINENSAAVAVYDDGCEIRFDKPGVYEVPNECKRGAWMANSKTGVNTWLIVGGAAVAAILIGSNSGSDDPPPPPLSTGAR